MAYRSAEALAEVAKLIRKILLLKEFPSTNVFNVMFLMF